MQGGALATLKRVAVRFGPQLAALAIAAGVAAKALQKLSRITDESIKATDELIRNLRAQGPIGRSPQEQQAIMAAQQDLFARGAGFQQQRMREAGTLFTSEQLSTMARLNDSNQQVAQQSAALKMTIANEFAPLTAGIKQLTATTLRWVRESVETGSDVYGAVRDTFMRMSLSQEAFAVYQRGMMGRALQAQADAARLQEKTTADVSGTLSAAETGQAGARSEYQLFVKQQELDRNTQIDLARQQVILLRDLVIELRQQTPAIASTATPTVAVP
jgi:hypothetical protein